MNNRKGTWTIRNLMVIPSFVPVQEPKNRGFMCIDLATVYTCIVKIKYSLSCSDSLTLTKTTYYHRK